MLWVEMGPPKKDGGVLALSTPGDMTLFGEDLCKDNEVKMRSLIQYNRCPYKRGKFGHRVRHTPRTDYVNPQKTPCGDKGRDWSDLGYHYPRYPRDRLSPKTSDRTNPAHILILDFHRLELTGKKFPLFQSAFVVLCSRQTKQSIAKFHLHPYPLLR